jgi:NitT/TauT family transport system substrate-binding protein
MGPERVGQAEGVRVSHASGSSRLLVVRRRLATLLLCITLVAVGPLSCTPASAPRNLATSVWPGYEPIFLANELGYLDSGSVRLREMPSATVVLAAFRSGRIDIAALTLDEALRLERDGVDVRVVLVMDTSNGADVLMAGQGVRSLADLRGKRVGVENGALGAYMLSRALDHAGLSPSDVTVVSIPVDMQEDAYVTGEVDAVVTFEPVRTKLLAQGAHVLFDSSLIPNEIFDVLVMRKTTFDESPATVANLTDAWYRALDYYHARPEDALRRMAAHEDVSPQAFSNSLDGLTIPSRAENDRLLGGTDPAILAPAQRLADAMLKAGVLDGPVDPRPLLGLAPRGGAGQ